MASEDVFNILLFTFFMTLTFIFAIVTFGWVIRRYKYPIRARVLWLVIPIGWGLLADTFLSGLVILLPMPCRLLTGMIYLIGPMIFIAYFLRGLRLLWRFEVNSMLPAARRGDAKAQARLGTMWNIRKFVDAKNLFALWLFLAICFFVGLISWAVVDNQYWLTGETDCSDMYTHPLFYFSWMLLLFLAVLTAIVAQRLSRFQSDNFGVLKELKRVSIWSTFLLVTTALLQFEMTTGAIVQWTYFFKGLIYLGMLVWTFLWPYYQTFQKKFRHAMLPTSVSSMITFLRDRRNFVVFEEFLQREFATDSLYFIADLLKLEVS